MRSKRGLIICGRGEPLSFPQQVSQQAEGRDVNNIESMRAEFSLVFKCALKALLNWRGDFGTGLPPLSYRSPLKWPCRPPPILPHQSPPKLPSRPPPNLLSRSPPNFWISHHQNYRLGHHQICRLGHQATEIDIQKLMSVHKRMLLTTEIHVRAQRFEPGIFSGNGSCGFLKVILL